MSSGLLYQHLPARCMALSSAGSLSSSGRRGHSLESSSCEQANRSRVGNSLDCLVCAVNAFACETSPFRKTCVFGDAFQKRLACFFRGNSFRQCSWKRTSVKAYSPEGVQGQSWLRSDGTWA